MWPMARKHKWGEVYEPLVDDEWPHNPIFVRNCFERAFSIIPNLPIFDQEMVSARNPRM
jgi:hypothetical protein